MTTGDGDHGPTGDPASLTPARVAHFRILAKLGQGGMGVVYRAEDEKLRRAVAIKLLQDTGSDERRQRFLREARSAAAVTHPNVAVVHAVDEVDGRIYIAMELVEGENLRDRMDRGRLDLATAKDLAVQIARGLAFSFGIVLYEMLSGVRPFAGESTAAVLAAVLRRRPPVRAKELLARTYEEKGDVARACEAYGQVLRTWPKPVPRSVTIEEARAHSKKLGCAP